MQKKGVLAYYCQKGGYNDQNKLDAQRGNRRPLYECLSQLNPFSVLREKKKKRKTFRRSIFLFDRTLHPSPTELLQKYAEERRKGDGGDLKINYITEWLGTLIS